MISPLLFNAFFAVVNMTVVLKRFAAEPVIVSNLVHLDNAPKVRMASLGRGELKKWFGERCG